MACANFLYRARQNVEWDFLEKRIPRNMGAWACNGGRNFLEKRIPRNVWAWACNGGRNFQKIRRSMSNVVYDKSI